MTFDLERFHRRLRDEMVRLAIKREGELRRAVLNPFHVTAFGSEYPLPTKLIAVAQESR